MRKDIWFGAILIICTVGIILLLSQYNWREHFFSSSNYITLFKDTEKQNIVLDNDTYDESINHFVTLTQNKYQIIRSESVNSNDIVCSSILSVPAQSQLLAVTNDQMMCCFLRHTQSIELKTISDVLKAYTKIYYLNDHDLKLLAGIITSTEIPVTNEYMKSLIKLDTIEEATKLIFGQSPTNEVFFWSGNPKNPRVIEALSRQTCSILSFDESKNELLRFFLPTVVVGNYDFKLLFSKNIDRFSVKKTLFYRNVLSIQETNPQTYLLKYVIRYFEKNKDFLAYYETQNYKILDSSRRILWQSFETFVEKSAIIDSSISFEPQKKVRVYIDSASDELHFVEPKEITDVTLRIGDIILLKNQERKIENGMWSIIRFDSEENAFIAKRSSSDKWTMFKNEEEDPRYICYGDSQLVIKGLCESEIGLNGNKKKKGVWDRPCDYDNECPFFQKNTNYKNYRGSCNSGYCELPLGVKRTGFRTYEGEPFCHGCEMNDSKCCEKQNKPDYAFVFDEYERRPKVILESFDSDNYENREFLAGDFSVSTQQRQYHDEISNEEMTQLITIVIGKSLTVDSNNEINFAVLLDEFIHSTKNDDSELSQFSSHDVKIISKDIKIEDGFAITYIIDATLYRQDKSHGKRVRIFMDHDSKSNTFTIQKTKVLGYVPQYDIDRKIDGSDKKILTNRFESSGISCFNDTFDEIINPYVDPEEYICEKIGKKLGVDRNLTMPNCKL
jgi:hypothetical protein